VNYKGYFWELNEKALNQTIKILKNPHHPKFVSRFFTLLSRCDEPKKVFSLISKKQFMEIWPKIRNYWRKIGEKQDFLAWWETIYDELLEEFKGKEKKAGEPLKVFQDIGKEIKRMRIEKGWSQEEVAKRAGMEQPDISLIERGKKNITLETLIRLCRILDIKKIEFKIK